MSNKLILTAAVIAACGINASAAGSSMKSVRELPAPKPLYVVHDKYLPLEDLKIAFEKVKMQGHNMPPVATQEPLKGIAIEEELLLHKISWRGEKPFIAPKAPLVRTAAIVTLGQFNLPEHPIPHFPQPQLRITLSQGNDMFKLINGFLVPQNSRKGSMLNAQLAQVAAGLTEAQNPLYTFEAGQSGRRFLRLFQAVPLFISRRIK